MSVAVVHGNCNMASGLRVKAAPMTCPSFANEDWEGLISTALIGDSLATTLSNLTSARSWQMRKDTLRKIKYLREPCRPYAATEGPQRTVDHFLHLRARQSFFVRLGQVITLQMPEDYPRGVGGPSLRLIALKNIDFILQASMSHDALDDALSLFGSLRLV